jgi:pimeloyl-ACP methyl ester carboxylesterase
VSGPTERRVEAGAATAPHARRVWEKGEGERLGVLPGLLGWATWTPFLEALAARRRVVVPALPGTPGGGEFRDLDDLADWVTATLDLLEAADLAGADLVGLGPGAALAAEAAAFAPGLVRRLVLVSPLGLFTEAEPVADFWAQRGSELPAILSARPEAFAREVLACPEGEDEVEWQVAQTRALEATARLFWPTCDRGLRKRLHRIRCDTLIVHGAEDRILPASYAKRFADGISGRTEIRSLPDAGHRADFDAPGPLAEAILDFTE